MPRLLILTQYYPPETGAPQNRLSSLALHLANLGWQVSVLTAMPSYPKSEIFEGYRGKWYKKEQMDGITVYRSWIFVSKKTGITWRLLNYFSFVFSALITGLFKVKKHEVIICESPPLFLGITAMILKWLKRSKLVFNVSDLWPETAEQLGIITNKAVLKISTLLEQTIYKRSNFISGQTQGIVNNISKRFPAKKVVWLPNGIDEDRFTAAGKTGWRYANGYHEDDFLVLYGGILGYAQNLEVVLKAAKLLKEEHPIKFAIVGDGPNRNNLHEWKDKLQLDNVTFYPSQPAENMPAIIEACNAGVIPLRDISLFHGAIPSKIFEYLLLGKPILLGVDGEAKELFISQGKCGLFFTPQDERSLADNILMLKANPALAETFGRNGERYVKAKFNRKTIAYEFNRHLQLLAGHEA